MNNVTSINERLKHGGSAELSLADIWHGILHEQRQSRYKIGWAGFTYEDITGRDPRADFTESWDGYEPVYNPEVSALVAQRQADMREKNKVGLEAKTVDDIRHTAGLYPSSSMAKHGKATNQLLKAVLAFAQNNERFADKGSIDDLCDFLSGARVTGDKS